MDEFMAPMKVFAVAVHEFYLEFVAAGFSEAQALSLATTYMIETIRMGGGVGEE